MKGKHQGVIVVASESAGTSKPKKTSKTSSALVDKSDVQSDFKTAAGTHSFEPSQAVDQSLSAREPSVSVEESLDGIDADHSADPIPDKAISPVLIQPKAVPISKPIKSIKAKAKSKKSPKKPNFVIEGTNEILDTQLLSKSLIFQIIYYILSALTLGLLNLLNKWSNNKLYCRSCFRTQTALDDADYVALTDAFGFFVVVPLTFKNVFVSQELELETFIFEHNYRSFYFDEADGKFKNLAEVAEREITANFSRLYKSARLETDVAALRDTFGPNKLQPNLKSFKSLVLESVLTPLVVFEGICLTLILLNGQTWYFYLLLTFFCGVIIFNVAEKYRAETRLLESINFAEKVMVVRKTSDGVFKKKIIDSTELVIGDLVEITNNLRVPADMILTRGACIIKEDFNRESPQTSTRVALDTMGVDQPSSPKCALLAGNQVLYTLNQINDGCFAMVLRTGFNCKRAEKLKLIINNQIRQKQSTWEIVLLVALLALCCLYPLVLLVWRIIFHKGGKLSHHDLLAQLTDLILIALKPIVPLLILIVFKLSTNRLSSNGVTVNDKQKLQEAGRLREIIFENKLLLAEDKTTAGFVLCNSIELGHPVFEKIQASSKRLWKSAELSDNARRFCEVAGLCNLVFKVGNEYYGSETEQELLSESAFNLTNYYTNDNGCGRVFTPKLEALKFFAKEYHITRFLASKRTDSHKVQSVLAKAAGEFLVLTKGEPKAIEDLFDERSLPANYHSRIAKYANKGFKCLAFGYKKVSEEESQGPVEDLEHGLTFVGFYLFKFAAPENVTEVTRTLMHNDIRLTLMTHGSIFSGIATARNHEIIAADKKVILLQTEVVDGIERFVVTLIEPKIGTVSIEESAAIGERLNIVTLSDSNGTDVLQSADAIAITGKAFSLLQQKDAQENLAAVLDKCRVYGDLTNAHRMQIVKLLRERDPENPIGYVYEDMGNENTIREADVSINLRASSLSSYSTFSSASADLSQVVDIIREGRATHSNLSQAIHFSVFFVALQLVGYGLLLARDTSFSRSQLFFLDFFVLAGFALFQANLKPTELSAETPSKGVLNQIFAVRVCLTVGVAGFFLAAITWLLSKTKFYITPAVMAANTKDKSPDSFFFYDPFTVFITLVFINIFFVFQAHRNNQFVKNFFGKVGLLIYWVLLFTFALYVLFVYHFSTKWIVNQKLIKSFRIPGLFHFEVIIFLFLPLIYGGFNFARYVEDRLTGKGAVKTLDTLEEVSVDEEPEVSLKKKRKAALVEEKDESQEGSVKEVTRRKASSKVPKALPAKTTRKVGKSAKHNLD
jgi:magnesium-transporting ATPase (P-type)